MAERQNGRVPEKSRVSKCEDGQKKQKSCTAAVANSPKSRRLMYDMLSTLKHSRCFKASFRDYDAVEKERAKKHCGEVLILMSSEDFLFAKTAQQPTKTQLLLPKSRT
eukprot:scaffold1311_cov256-Pinguiococcus_pyrenoidosus.AAC.36